MNSDQSSRPRSRQLKSLVDQKKVDFIFMGSYAPGGASATKQIRAAGINLPIIGGAGFDGTFWLGAVPNLKNFYVVAGGVTTGGDPNKLRAAVYTAYKAKYKKDAPLGEQTLNGYSAVYAFAKAIERAESINGAKVVAQLEKFRNQPLPIGNITWTSKCHISKLRSLPIITFVGTQGEVHRGGRAEGEHLPEDALLAAAETIRAAVSAVRPPGSLHRGGSR